MIGAKLALPLRARYRLASLGDFKACYHNKFMLEGIFSNTRSSCSGREANERGEREKASDD